MRALTAWRWTPCATWPLTGKGRSRSSLSKVHHPGGSGLHASEFAQLYLKACLAPADTQDLFCLRCIVVIALWYVCMAYACVESALRWQYCLCLVQGHTFWCLARGNDEGGRR